MRKRIVCLHARNNKVLGVHVDEDQILLSKKPVVVVIDGQRYEVREGRKEIEDLIKEA